MAPCSPHIYDFQFLVCFLKVCPLPMTQLSTSGLTPGTNPPQTSAPLPPLAFASVLTSTPNSCLMALFPCYLLPTTFSPIWLRFYCLLSAPKVRSAQCLLQPFFRASSTFPSVPLQGTSAPFLSSTTSTPFPTGHPIWSPCFLFNFWTPFPQYYPCHLLPGLPVCSLWLNLAV